MLSSPVQSGGSGPALIATAVGMAAAGAGVWLTTGKRLVARLMLPFSAGVLLGVAVFGLLPELALEAGWTASLVLFAAGYGLLLVVNRYVHPICPTCAHDHDHNACVDELHGFAGPLMAAAAIHSFLDGWSIALAQAAGGQATTFGLSLTVPLAVTLHKIPEGMALGGLLRSAARSRMRAVTCAFVAEGSTLVGAVFGRETAPSLGSAWLFYPLGLTAGWIFYLGFHALHQEWKRQGARPAFVSALTGVAGAAVIQRGAEALFR